MEKVKLSSWLGTEDSYIKYLCELGAGQYRHINGSLLEHLQGTYKILSEWKVAEQTAIAGLFHAVYGPQGLSKGLVTLQIREKIRDKIGVQTEKLVYLYCACDKAVVLPQFAYNESIIFQDRFTGERYPFPLQFLQGFCEITVANDIDVAQQKENWTYDDSIIAMFKSMQRMLNINAQTELKHLFNVYDSQAGGLEIINKTI